jgi:methylated-DNA-[protein]-cysteine S-methyltransferase
MTTHYRIMKSPIGPLYLVEENNELRVVTFANMWPTFKKKFSALEEKATPVLKQAETQLKEYFSGQRRTFDLPLKMTGTKFQNSVWSALGKIPFAETRTYKQQAEVIRSPKAVRAVGRTNGLNPFCIVLPCHRVVGSNGSLTGFAGGLKTKEFLLKFEATAVA